MAREGTPFAGTAAALVLTPNPQGASPLSFRLWGDRGRGSQTSPRKADPDGQGCQQPASASRAERESEQPPGQRPPFDIIIAARYSNP